MSESKANVDGSSHRAKAGAALVVGALGIVFGDIGTSPIYTVQTVFNPGDPHPVSVSIQNVYGIASLIFWAVTIIVTLKYVLLVLRADNDGEGGIMALIALIRRIGAGDEQVSAASLERRVMSGRYLNATRVALAALGIFGASLFFGDSMITPAISVLSAVEGLEVVQPSFDSAVVPITAIIVIALFAIQRYGTARVGRTFGPVMILWFSTIAALGIHGIALHPEVVKALSPTYAIDFMIDEGSTAFFSLAAVVLAVTGAEALYADLGHFGRSAITRAWLLMVFPALILCYLGQAGLILDNPAKNIDAPFFRLAPEWAQLPLVLLATTAAVIASQAVISGAYSVARQAVQLGYLPRLRIVHTSEHEIGQVYVPLINWLLLTAVLILVFAFQSSAKLGFAYGMAVTGTIAINSLLFFYVVRHRWGRPAWLVGTAMAFFLSVELAFLAANLTKFVHGGWLPLLIGLASFTILTTWQRGRALVTEQRVRAEGPLSAFIARLGEAEPPVTRVPGTAVFLNRGKATAPLAMRATVEHNHALHEHAVVLSIDTVPVPRVPESERLSVDDLGHQGDGIFYVSASYGYIEEPDVPALMRRIDELDFEGDIDSENPSYFLSRIELRHGDAPGMSRWRKQLFLATASLASEAADYFKLPREKTVIMGSQIEF